MLPRPSSRCTPVITLNAFAKCSPATFFCSGQAKICIQAFHLESGLIPRNVEENRCPKR